MEWGLPPARARERELRQELGQELVQEQARIQPPPLPPPKEEERERNYSPLLRGGREGFLPEAFQHCLSPKNLCYYLYHFFLTIPLVDSCRYKHLPNIISSRILHQSTPVPQ